MFMFSALSEVERWSKFVEPREAFAFRVGEEKIDGMQNLLHLSTLYENNLLMWCGLF